MPPLVLEREELASAIALAASKFGDLLDLVDSHKGALAELEDQAVAVAHLAYDTALRNTLEHIQPIIKNNPGKTFAQIFARADVQLELQDQLTRAKTLASKAMHTAHSKGGTLGAKHAAQETAHLGLKKAGAIAKPTTAYLDSVLADLDNMATQSVGRLLNAAEEGFGIPQLNTAGYPNLPANVRRDLAVRRAALVSEHMQREGTKLGQRAGAGASVVANHTYSEAQQNAYQAVQEANPGKIIQKVWVTNFSPATCGACAALHGHVLGIHEEFDHGATFAINKTPPKVYINLELPPRHPHCRCRVMLYVSTMNKPGDATSPETMRQFGKDFATHTEGMAPNPTPSTLQAPSTGGEFMHSDQLKGMSDDQFDVAVHNFRECAMGKIPKPPE